MFFYQRFLEEVLRQFLRPFLVLSFASFWVSAQEASVELDIFSDQLASQLQAVSYQQELMLHGFSLGASLPAESLSLQRFDVFEDGARVFVHGDEGTDIVAPPRHQYFRGEVDGLDGSRAFVSVREDGRVSGIVGFEGRYWRLEPPATRQPGQPLLSEIDLSAADMPADHPGFSCASDQLPDVDAFDRHIEPLRQAPPRFTGLRGGDATYYASIGLATDYELFQRFNDVNAMMTYIADLFAYISAIYEAEVDTHLVIADTDIWTTDNDPWQSTSAGCQLSEFARYWNNTHPDRPRTIGHFLSGKNAGGGVAWVGVLCSGSWSSDPNPNCPELGTQRDRFGGPYGVSSGISNRFNVDNPVMVWDIMVVAHEIGHNFNSGHTHCYKGIGGSDEPVDKCATGGGSCHTGETELPCDTPGAGCATIMSYCHGQSGGIRNVSPTFGRNHGFGVLPDRVPDRMNAHVIARAANNPDCLPQACFAPTITRQPTSTSACVADTVVFSVEHSFGSRYQWRKDGQDLSGETNASLQLSIADNQQAGSYTCVVSNDCSSTQSEAAVLTLDAGFGAEIQPGAWIVQGLEPVSLQADISCSRPDVTWTWQDGATGNVLAQNVVNFTMPFRYEETTTVHLRVQDHQSNEIVRDMIVVRAPQDRNFDDLNGDGCNTLDDLRFLSQWWRTQRSDANGDNIIDVRDFLYLNVDQTTCD